MGENINPEVQKRAEWVMDQASAYCEGAGALKPAIDGLPDAEVCDHLFVALMALCEAQKWLRATATSAHEDGMRDFGRWFANGGANLELGASSETASESHAVALAIER